VTRGYRKIPGNACQGGLQLQQYVYKCNASGWLSRFILTAQGVVIIIVLVVGIYLTPVDWIRMKARQWFARDKTNKDVELVEKRL
jgi:hypothetical protein